MEIDCYAVWGYNEGQKILDNTFDFGDNGGYTGQSIMLDINNDNVMDICNGYFCYDITDTSSYIDIREIMINKGINITCVSDTSCMTSFGDVNNDGVIDFFISNISSTAILMSSDFINEIPEVSAYYYYPANPICTDNTVFIKAWVDNDEYEQYNIEYKCFTGDDWKSSDDGFFLYLDENNLTNSEINCTYNETGIYNIYFRLADLYHWPTYGDTITHTVQVNDIVGCYNNDDVIGGVTEPIEGVIGEDENVFLESIGIDSLYKKIFMALIIQLILSIIILASFRDNGIATVVALGIVNTIAFVGFWFLNIYPTGMIITTFFFLMILGFIIWVLSKN